MEGQDGGGELQYGGRGGLSHGREETYLQETLRCHLPRVHQRLPHHPHDDGEGALACMGG